MVKKNTILESILFIIFIIFALIFIAQLILKITGHSPTEIQLLYIGFGGMFAFLIMMIASFYTFKGKVEEFMSTTKNNFHHMRSDIRDLKQNQNKMQMDIVGIKGNITNLKSNVKHIKTKII